MSGVVPEARFGLIARGGAPTLLGRRSEPAFRQQAFHCSSPYPDIALVKSTEGTSDDSTSVSSDRRAQRGS
jgi:hypothetical protein